MKIIKSLILVLAITMLTNSVSLQAQTTDTSMTSATANSTPLDREDKYGWLIAVGIGVITIGVVALAVRNMRKKNSGTTHDSDINNPASGI